MTRTAVAEVGLADVDDRRSRHPERGQLGDRNGRVLASEASCRRYVEEARRLIAWSYNDVHTGFGRHTSVRKLREWNPARKAAQIDRFGHVVAKAHRRASAMLRS